MSTDPGEEFVLEASDTTYKEAQFKIYMRLWDRLDDHTLKESIDRCSISWSFETIYEDIRSFSEITVKTYVVGVIVTADVLVLR